MKIQVNWWRDGQEACASATTVCGRKARSLSGLYGKPQEALMDVGRRVSSRWAQEHPVQPCKSHGGDKCPEDVEQVWPQKPTRTPSEADQTGPEGPLPWSSRGPELFPPQ